MSAKAYIETSVISLLTARPSRDLIVAAMQEATCEWWETKRLDVGCYVSELVLDEAAAGDADAARRRLAAVTEFEILLVNDTVRNVAAHLLNQAGLPPEVTDDVLHIAVSAVYGMNYLVTWNCAHIANPHWQPRIAAVIMELGFVPPVICTPQALLEGE